MVSPALPSPVGGGEDGGYPCSPLTLPYAGLFLALFSLLGWYHPPCLDAPPEAEG